MAPVTKPVKVIRIHVPRHNAQRIGNKLNAEVKKIAKQRAIVVETHQTNPDLAPAAGSASEWNSLLMTARAERGPQWDIGTQQFHVDTNSDLYYNPTPLLEVVRKELEDDSSDIQAQLHVTQHGQHLPPGHPGSMSHPGQQLPPGVFHPGTRHQTPMRGGDPRGEFHNMPPGMHPQMVQGGGHPHGPPPSAQMNFPSGGFPGASGASVMNMRQGFPVTPFNAGPPGQFFSSDSGASPMRGPPAHMGGMNVSVGMPGGGIAGMGGMPRGMPPPGMNLNMPPEVRRMRGMPEDFPIN